MAGFLKNGFLSKAESPLYRQNDKTTEEHKDIVLTRLRNKTIDGEILTEKQIDEH